MVKDDWPPKYCLKFWSLDLVCKWSKIIDPPSLSLSLSKILLEILKFRFSLHMVSKMIDPHLSLQNSTGNFKV